MTEPYEPSDTDTWVGVAAVTIIMNPQILDEALGVPLGTHGKRWSNDLQATVLLDIMGTPEAQARLAMVGGRVGLATYDLYNGPDAVTQATELIMDMAVDMAAHPDTQIIDYTDREK